MITIGRGACVGGWVTKIATKKIKPTFSIFLAVIFVTQFSNCLKKTQYREFEGPAIAMDKFSKMLDEDIISRI